jgi:hypothetical protein
MLLIYQVINEFGVEIVKQFLLFVVSDRMQGTLVAGC